MKIFNKLTLATLIVTCAIISIYRINVVRENEISWDVLGYYLYLPATFIHHDPMLNDISWIKQVNEEKKLAGTLYMVSQNKEGEPMYFFLMGMAFFYLPFFFLGSTFASLFGYSLDGFSIPYQYFLVIGGIIYTIIGLIFLRKILTRFFSERLSSLLILIIVFGTNYINHLTIDDLSTVNVIFMLTTIIVWNTIKWHENFKGKHLIAICICVTLAALVKPSEIFVLFLPLLWNVTSMEKIKQKISMLIANKKHILIAIIISLIIALPQMLYWHHKTGQFIYDSYKNPGVGLDFFSPHIIDVLFSYRKGWLLYTPMMIFSFIGFYFLYKKNRQIFYACAVYFLASFYIIASWTEWWYGAGFSTRPLISTYPILAICLGYFLLSIKNSKLIIRLLLGVMASFFMFLNQFQWWQYKNYILDPYRTTKAYYWATFLKTNVTESDRKLLMVFRDASGKMDFTEQHNYQKTLLLTNDFEEESNKGNQAENNNNFYRLTEDQEYFPILETQYNELTRKDHIWIKASMDIRFQKDFEGTLPCLVHTMERRNGSYGYHTTEIKLDSLPNRWRRVEVMYITPEIRSGKDRYKCYIWKRGKSTFEIDNLKLEIYKSKL
jgi:hypothetical protein